MEGVTDGEKEKIVMKEKKRLDENSPQRYRPMNKHPTLLRRVVTGLFLLKQPRNMLVR